MAGSVIPITANLRARDNMSGTLKKMNKHFAMMSASLRFADAAAATLTIRIGDITSKIGGFFFKVSKEAGASAMDLEKDMKMIAGVSGATDDEIDKLNKSFLSLANKGLPIAARELSKVGLEAARMGLRGLDVDIVSRQASILATIAGDLNPTEAAEMVSQSLRILQEGAFAFRGDKLEKEINKFTSALIAAANEATTTPKKLMKFIPRMGAVAKDLNMGTSEVLGFAAAAANIGMPAERASRAFARLFQQMTKPKNFKAIGEMFNMTTEQLDAIKAKDFGGANIILNFLDVLNRKIKYGKTGEADILLRQFGLGSRAQFIALYKGLAPNIGNIVHLVNKSSEAFASQNEHTKFFNKMMESAAVKVDRFNALWQNFITRIGYDVTNSFKGMVDIGNELLVMLNNINPAVLKFLGFTNALAGVFFTATGAVLKFIGSFGSLRFLLFLMARTIYPELISSTTGLIGPLGAIFRKELILFRTFVRGAVTSVFSVKAWITVLMILKTTLFTIVSLVTSLGIAVGIFGSIGVVAFKAFDKFGSDISQTLSSLFNLLKMIGTIISKRYSKSFGVVEGVLNRIDKAFSGISRKVTGLGILFDKVTRELARSFNSFFQTGNLSDFESGFIQFFKNAAGAVPKDVIASLLKSNIDEQNRELEKLGQTLIWNAPSGSTKEENLAYIKPQLDAVISKMDKVNASYMKTNRAIIGSEGMLTSILGIIAEIPDIIEETKAFLAELSDGFWQFIDISDPLTDIVSTFGYIFNFIINRTTDLAKALLFIFSPFTGALDLAGESLGNVLGDALNETWLNISFFVQEVERTMQLFWFFFRGEKHLAELKNFLANAVKFWFNLFSDLGSETTFLQEMEYAFRNIQEWAIEAGIAMDKFVIFLQTKYATALEKFFDPKFQKQLLEAWENIKQLFADFKISEKFLSILKFLGDTILYLSNAAWEGIKVLGRFIGIFKDEGVFGKNASVFTRFLGVLILFTPIIIMITKALIGMLVMTQSFWQVTQGIQAAQIIFSKFILLLGAFMVISAVITALDEMGITLGITSNSLESLWNSIKGFFVDLQKAGVIDTITNTLVKLSIVFIKIAFALWDMLIPALNALKPILKFIKIIIDLFVIVLTFFGGATGQATSQTNMFHKALAFLLIAIGALWAQFKIIQLASFIGKMTGLSALLKLTTIGAYTSAAAVGVAGKSFGAAAMPIGRFNIMFALAVAGFAAFSALGFGPLGLVILLSAGFVLLASKFGLATQASRFLMKGFGLIAIAMLRIISTTLFFGKSLPRIFALSFIALGHLIFRFGTLITLMNPVTGIMAIFFSIFYKGGLIAGFGHFLGMIIGQFLHLITILPRVILSFLTFKKLSLTLGTGLFFGTTAKGITAFTSALKANVVLTMTSAIFGLIGGLTRLGFVFKAMKMSKIAGAFGFLGLMGRGMMPGKTSKSTRGARYALAMRMAAMNNAMGSMLMMGGFKEKGKKRKEFAEKRLLMAKDMKAVGKNRKIARTSNPLAAFGMGYAPAVAHSTALAGTSVAGIMGGFLPLLIGVGAFIALLIPFLFIFKDSFTAVLASLGIVLAGFAFVVGGPVLGLLAAATILFSMIRDPGGWMKLMEYIEDAILLIPKLLWGLIKGSLFLLAKTAWSIFGSLILMTFGSLAKGVDALFGTDIYGWILDIVRDIHGFIDKIGKGFFSYFSHESKIGKWFRYMEDTWMVIIQKLEDLYYKLPEFIVGEKPEKVSREPIPLVKTSKEIRDLFSKQRNEKTWTNMLIKGFEGFGGIVLDSVNAATGAGIERTGIWDIELKKALEDNTKREMMLFGAPRDWLNSLTPEEKTQWKSGTLKKDINLEKQYPGFDSSKAPRVGQLANLRAYEMRQDNQAQNINVSNKTEIVFPSGHREEVYTKTQQKINENSGKHNDSITANAGTRIRTPQF